MTFTEFYCISASGNNMNGGSSSGAAIYTSTNGGWDGSSIFTPTDGSNPSSSIPNTGGVPNSPTFLSVYNDGSSTPVYSALITNVTNAVNGTITIDNTKQMGSSPTSSGTGRSCKAGGAWAGPTGTTSWPLGSIQSSTTDASGNPPRVNMIGTFNVTAAIAALNIGPYWIEGATASPGDGGQATIADNGGGASYTLISSTSNVYFRNITFGGNGGSGSNQMVQQSSRGTFENCVFTASKGEGVKLTSGPNDFIRCEFYGCNTSNTASRGAVNVAPAAVGISNNFIRCVFHDNTGGNVPGVYSNGGGYYEDCIFDTNGASGLVQAANNTGLIVRGGVFYGQTGAGIDIAATGVAYFFEDVTFDSNSTWGIKNAGASANNRVSNCSFFNNTSGTIQNPTRCDTTGTITLSASSLADPANGDFTNISPATAAAGAGGYSQISGYTKSTTSYPDVGIQGRRVRNVGIMTGIRR